MSKRAGCEMAGGQFRISLSLSVGAVMNCTDNIVTKNIRNCCARNSWSLESFTRCWRRLYVCGNRQNGIAWNFVKRRPILKQLTCNPPVVIRQRKSFRRKDGGLRITRDSSKK
ncbi:large ribosomal subunit protein uL14-like isoform 1-T1 [Glossina fuscipes fuscipes]